MEYRLKIVEEKRKWPYDDFYCVYHLLRYIHSLMSSVKSPADILFLPGVLNNRALWNKVIGYLPDNLRFHFAETHHWSRMECIADHVLAKAPQHFFLVGFSMGGYVSLEILHQAPERVQGFALVNSKATMDDEKEKHRRKIAINSASHLHDSQFLGVTPRLLRKLVAQKNQNNTKIASCVYKMAQEIGRKGFLNQQVACLHRKNRQAELTKFTKPCLIFSGEEDQLIPPEDSTAIYPKGNCKSMVIAEVGHLSPLEAPEELSQALIEQLRSI